MTVLKLTKNNIKIMIKIYLVQKHHLKKSNVKGNQDQIPFLDPFLLKFQEIPKTIVNPSNLYNKKCCARCKVNDKSNRKTCVCVVPRNQRRIKLGEEGCRTCKCQGCTKEDKLYFNNRSKYEKLYSKERSRGRDHRDYRERGRNERDSHRDRDRNRDRDRYRDRDHRNR